MDYRLEPDLDLRWEQLWEKYGDLNDTDLIDSYNCEFDKEIEDFSSISREDVISDLVQNEYHTVDDFLEVDDD